MRAIALKGYSMNEYCLSHKNTKIELNSDEIFNKIKKSFELEKDIFDFLDMEYVKPIFVIKLFLDKFKNLIKIKIILNNI